MGKNKTHEEFIYELSIKFHYNDFYKDGSFETLKYHDKLKDEYAKEYGWKLIRIPYWEYNNIEDILNKILNKNN